MEIPPLSASLIALLDELYPEKCPAPDMTDREIWMYAGARGVVRILVESLKQQEAEDPFGLSERRST